MTEVVVEVGVSNRAEEVAFVKALDKYTHWLSTRFQAADEMPQLMVHTACNEDGGFRKSVTVHTETGREVFIRFLSAERTKAA